MRNDAEGGNRRRAESRGRWAEIWAAVYLACKLYRVLDVRMRNHAGEVDLIARSPSGILCFVEVKARGSQRDAAESVTPTKRDRIAGAASLYLSTRPALRHKGVRFDVLLVVKRRWPRHVKDAWRPGW